MTVKEMRKSAGLTQQKFGDMFHISVVNIGHWEQGVATPPPYVTYMMEQILIQQKEIQDLKSALSERT
jgi:putative transcriptional regulator